VVSTRLSWKPAATCAAGPPRGSLTRAAPELAVVVRCWRRWPALRSLVTEGVDLTGRVSTRLGTRRRRSGRPGRTMRIDTGRAGVGCGVRCCPGCRVAVLVVAEGEDLAGGTEHQAVVETGGNLGYPAGGSATSEGSVGRVVALLVPLPSWPYSLSPKA